MYVWVDALTNYLTGLGYPDETPEMAKFWPADLHLIGKDIVRFHAVYWPAFLMSAGLALPKQVFGHGFLLNRGQKESKSLGNVTDPLELADRFGVDVLRYFLLREFTFGQDGSYSAEAIVTRANAELANSFGNLAQRTLSLISKNCEGVLRRRCAGHSTRTRAIARHMASVIARRDARRIREAGLRAGARKLDGRPSSPATPMSTSRRPGRCARPIRSGCRRVLATLYVVIAHLAIAVRPVMPGIGTKLLDAMGIAPSCAISRRFARTGIRRSRRAISGSTSRSRAVPAARTAAKRRRPDADR